MTLFAEPFDLDQVDHCLGGDWPRFAAAANFALGQRTRWDAAVDQVARLFDAFHAEGRDDRPLYLLFDMLWRRSWQLKDRASAHQAMVSAFDFMPPATLEAAAWSSSTAAQVKGDEQNWLEAYKARAAEERAKRWRGTL